MPLIVDTEAKRENVLLQRARAGDLKAFDQLFHHHHDRVYACLFQQLGNDRDTVEDAVGAVFLNAFLSLHRFAGKATFATYLYKIAINEAHYQRKKKQRELLYRVDEIFELDTIPGQELSTESFVVHSMEYQSLLRAVFSIPEPYRTPVLRRCCESQNSVEIARDLKRPESTIRFQIRRGLQILRERLPEHTHPLS